MSNGKNPLMLMMALTMPGAAHALGLGDIHVDSALNERFAAEIDIVGATALELEDLRATVANRDTFLRYGADRPAFLATAIFKVARDNQGRPVLAVRSADAFTEPVVNFLVDLHWRNGELVRQYTVLLDPAEFAAANRARAAATTVPLLPKIPDSTAALVAAAPPAAAPMAETQGQTVARQLDPPASASTAAEQSPAPLRDASPRKMTHIKVGAKATLRGIAWRIGERSDSDLQRMMIALFRANPAAFDGNINRLHLGAVLTVPTRADVEGISKVDARHEFHAQMAAWRSGGRAATLAVVKHEAVPPAASAPALPTAVAAAATMPAATAVPAAATSEDEALDHRIKSLEQELNEVRARLQGENDQLTQMQMQAARAERSTPAADSYRPAAAAAPAIAKPSHRWAPAAGGIGLLAAALAGLYLRLRRRPTPVRGDVRAADSAPASDAVAMPIENGTAASIPTPVTPPVPTAALPATAAAVKVDVAAFQDLSDDDTTNIQAILEGVADDATHPLLPVVPAAAHVGRSEISTAVLPRLPAQDPTVNLRANSVGTVSTVNMKVDPTRLDYNFGDLDMTAQHVQMPSVLNEHAVVKERRTNLADVLKLAIEREPDRHDLRMKLLELYFSAAATNRQAFLETVQKFARDRDYLQPDQWDKVAHMGRQIAAENPMFAEPAAADDDLADCA